jgi:UDP-2,3-diacylglucosamine pyrophosphatase LpxH
VKTVRLCSASCLRTVIVSDVHLGYERSDAAAFEQFLDSLLVQRPDRLVLLGDIFDFWRRSDAKLLTENQPIVEKLLQLPIVYVNGNHDYSMLKLSARFPEQPGFRVVPSLRLQNQKFVLIHGYDLEVFTSMETVGLDAYEAFSEAMCHAGEAGGTIASWIWEFVELVKGKLADAERTLLRQTAKEPAEIRQTLEKVDEFAKSPVRAIPLGLQPDDVLIFGHTHRPFKDDRTANTGSWVMERNKKEHTYVEITDNAFDLKQFPVSQQAATASLKYKPLTAYPRKKRSKKKP